MHDADGISMGPSYKHQPLDRAIVRQAAHWLSCLHSGAQTSAEELAACEQWRAANPEHERAWQHAKQINQKFGVIPAQIGTATLGRRMRVDRRAAMKTLVLLMTAAPVSYMAYHVTPWRSWTANYQTVVGERRTIDLEDGTRVHLGTASAMDVVYTETERLLVLHRGEIVVTTGSDEAYRAKIHRPFLVQAKHGRIRAIGTRFYVRQDDADTDRTYVTVMEGAVEIRPQRADTLSMRVPAGQQTSFSMTDIAALETANPHVADWTRGVLYARKMTLSAFLGELSRYRTGILRCDPAVADLLITGVFQLDHTDQILAALPETLPVKVTYRTRYWVSVMPPA